MNKTYTFIVCKCSSFAKASLTRTVRASEDWELQWEANNHSFDHVSQHIKEAAALLCAVNPTKLTFKQTYLTVFPARPMLRKKVWLKEK